MYLSAFGFFWKQTLRQSWARQFIGKMIPRNTSGESKVGEGGLLIECASVSWLSLSATRAQSHWGLSEKPPSELSHQGTAKPEYRFTDSHPLLADPGALISCSTACELNKMVAGREAKRQGPLRWEAASVPKRCLLWLQVNLQMGHLYHLL